MPEKLKKSLKDRMSKMRRNWILGVCKHPKTRTGSFDDQDHQVHHHHHRNKNKSNSGLVINKNRNSRARNAATLSDIDQFLIDNFKSLYLGDGELHGGGVDDVDNVIGEQTNQTNRANLSDQGAGDSFSSVTSEELVDYSEVKEEVKEIGPDKFMGVFTFSVSTNDDEFRQSMKEMVESRLHGQDGKAKWKFTEELLICYLNLDDKTSYKYILNAFLDLIVALGHEQY